MNAKLLALALACSPLLANAEDAPAAGILKSGVYLQNLDKSVRPQDDFYRHINGGWLASMQIPADRANYGTFTKLQEDAERDLRDMVHSVFKETIQNAKQATSAIIDYARDQIRSRAGKPDNLSAVVLRVPEPDETTLH